MQKSEQVHVELQRAAKALEAMKSAANIEELEESWKAFLHRLERTWNRALYHYGKSPKWNGWQANVLKLRKSDPLISYLINARGADEHTGDDIVSRTNGGIAINSSDGKALHIKHLRIDQHGMTYEGSSNSVLEFISSNIVPKDITNRGRLYSVPTSHLGSPIEEITIIHLAELGLAFYSDFISDVERVFVKQPRNSPL